jgi:hypothetical protein
VVPTTVAQPPPPPPPPPPTTFIGAAAEPPPPPRTTARPIPQHPRLFGDTTSTIAWLALIVALTSPLWEGTLLWSLGIRTPEIRTAQRTETALAQQQAALAAAEQKLAATAAQADSMRAAVTAATQRAATATEEVRTLAMLRLADALRSSNPFETELTILHSTGADGMLKPEFAQLQPYAAVGVPTLGQLRQDFRELYENMARTGQQAEPSSWRDLISWTGFGSGQPAPKNDPTLAAAWDGLGKLAASDLAGAIDQATRITGGFQAAFGDWIADARARLAADQALKQLDGATKRTPTAAATR